MSEHDDARRLNREWDDFVQTPRGARGTGESTDPTIHELHASAGTASPDPEFRQELKRRLIREASFRAGQQRAGGVPTPTTGHVDPADPRRFSRVMEFAAVMSVIVLIALGVVWSMSIRDDRTADPTPTLSLAATTVEELPATPEATPDASPSAETSPTLPASTAESSTPAVTATRESTPDATMEATASPTATSSPPVPTSTSTPSPTATPKVTVCNDLTTLLEPLASGTSITGIDGGVTATAQQETAIEDAFSDFVDCLSEPTPTELRTLIMSALGTGELSTLEAATIAQRIAGLTTTSYSISEARVLADGRAAALVTATGGATFVVLFTFDDGTSAATVTSLSEPAEAEPTATVAAPPQGEQVDSSSGTSGGNDNTGGGSSGGDDDDGDDDWSGDDDGDDDGGDDDDDD
jgi:hypothetical protein